MVLASVRLNGFYLLFYTEAPLSDDLPSQPLIPGQLNAVPQASREFLKLRPHGEILKVDVESNMEWHLIFADSDGQRTTGETGDV